MKKKLLSMLILAALFITLLPVSALASTTLWIQTAQTGLLQEWTPLPFETTASPDSWNDLATERYKVVIDQGDNGVYVYHSSSTFEVIHTTDNYEVTGEQYWSTSINGIGTVAISEIGVDGTLAFLTNLTLPYEGVGQDFARPGAGD